jgi:GntR family transcriptional repressor for pyruvate dehydrogenase complex
MTSTEHTTTAVRRGASNSVFAGILAYLQDRRLQPGDRLPSERDLAERLDVGRNAVREALATLVTLRVVESRPNSGIYLRHLAHDASFEAVVLLTDMGATPTPTEVAETMEVRAHLEVLAVRLACQRRDDADLARIAEILDRTDALLERKGNIAQIDTEFHIAVVDAAHNSMLVRTLNAFYRFTARRREVLFSDHAQGVASARDHRLLHGYIQRREVAPAEQLVLRHMERARNYWSNVLES